MKSTDRKAFLEIVIGFAELRGKQLSAPALELYWNAMQGWDFADFQAAANQLVRTCEWMPTPKHFEDLRKAGRPTAAEAWEAVCYHVRTSGYERGGINPLIDQTVRVISGGYRQLGTTKEADLHWMEKRFAQTYESLDDVQQTREALPQITLHQPTLTPRLAGDIKRLAASKVVA